MENKFIISDFYDTKLLGFEFHEKKPARIYDFSDEPVLGNIYCGYVKDIVKNLNAAFVEFEDKKGFLSLKGFPGTLKSGDKVLIQVSAEPVKTKDYSVTWHINLPSDCLVLTVGNTDISVSKKIEDSVVRNTLKSYLEPFRNMQYGFIFRTNSVRYTEEEIVAQAENLIQEYRELLKKFEFALPKSAIIKKNRMEECVRTFLEKYHGTILTDHRRTFEQLQSIKIEVLFNGNDKISLCNKYALDKHLREALSRKVWLKSGAYLVIEHTEAMTVIDINTGKAERKKDRESSFFKINLEAVEEIERQMMLRNLSGIIVIDFINMQTKEHYPILEQRMRDAVKKDFTQCDVYGFTRLGLMELSRRKYEKPLHEIFTDSGKK